MGKQPQDFPFNLDMGTAFWLHNYCKLLPGWEPVFLTTKLFTVCHQVFRRDMRALMRTVRECWTSRRMVHPELWRRWGRNHIRRHELDQKRIAKLHRPNGRSKRRCSSIWVSCWKDFNFQTIILHYNARIIYTRFCTKSAVLLRRIKKQKNKAEIKSRS